MSEARRTESGRRWFAVSVLHRAERAAVINMERQGFAAYTPVAISTTRHARQFRTGLAPVFPGYVFVALDLARDRWRSINSTRGVASLVMAGGEPVPVPHGIVEALIARAAGHGAIRFDHGLEVGQQVKILAGPFAGKMATLDRLDGRGRVRVLLEWMGTLVPMTSTTTEQLASA